MDISNRTQVNPERIKSALEKIERYNELKKTMLDPSLGNARRTQIILDYFDAYHFMERNMTIPILTVPKIRKVIFSNPATIILWADGSKTVVKCGEHDAYDPEKGLAMAIARKALGNKGNYYNTFEKWLPKESTITHSVTEFSDGFPAPSLEWRENNV